MSSKKRVKLASEEILQQTILDKSANVLELYKETDDIFKKTIDILEKTAIALGRKKPLKYSFSSTQNCEINYNAIPPNNNLV